MTQITAITAARVPKPVKPFLKWAGGKSRLLPQYDRLFPAAYGHYFEPFLGSGAVFLKLQPSPALLTDSNEELINCWQVVRDRVEDLIGSLQEHRVDREYYYWMRARDPGELSPVERASRLVLLNKTCYNGLYRVNSRGQFNVPFGDNKNPRIFCAEHLRAVSDLIQPTTLAVQSFDYVLRAARRGDFIYFDPPYLPLSTTSSFTGYTGRTFGEDQQRYVAEIYRVLHRRGCLVMLSNSDTELVRELYRGFRRELVWAARAINSVGSRRKAISELVILNY